jgi:16S rRNA (uracil1498-N3)-methyltransferase
MTLPVFAVDSDDLSSDVVEVSGAEGRHAVVVRRIRVGEQIVLTDTRGAGALCVVRSVSKQSLVADVLERRNEQPPSPRLVVVQAVPKGDHAERAVDLLTEVGVDEIVPWASTRTVVTWTGDREAKALARWRATAHAAAKQSRRLRFPAVAALHTTDRVADRIAAAALALVLHESADTSVTAHDTPVNGEILLVVGPEGGITDDELDRFTAAGAHPVRLGPSVLRSSTAGVVAAAAVLSRTARWT